MQAVPNEAQLALPSPLYIAAAELQKLPCKSLVLIGR